MRLFFIGCAVTLWPSRTATNGPATQSLGRLGDGRLLEFVRNICLICLSALGRRFRDKSEAKFEGRTLTHQTTLDVTRYARLWRLMWWTQHLAWPLATFGALVILFDIAWQALGQLEDWEEHLRNNISFLSETQREQRLAVIVAVFRLARDSVGPGLPWVVILAAAFLFELFVYLRGCGRFRLPLLSWSLAGLIVTAAVALLGIGYAEMSIENPEAIATRPTDVQTVYYLLIYLFAVLAFFISLVALGLRAIAIVLLWRHRLKPGLARTERMTRSLGVNLKIPQLAWPRPSLAGFTAHACILLVLGTLAYFFREWIVRALIFGSINLFLLVFGMPLQLIGDLYNFLTGKPTLGLAETWMSFLESTEELPQLLLLIGIVLLARALWRVGRRLNLRHRNEIILRDKPPVLLLRSFTDDVAGISPNALIPRLVRRRKRLEETIGEQLTGAGPFVAIGRPGERLPQLGASRLYLGDSEWQAVVESYIARSDLIVMIAGKTQWVQWELANVLKQDRLAALLIVFPRITETDRNERWQNLKAAFSDTAWSAAMEGVDIARALAVFIAADRGIVVIKSRKANQSDYEAALRVATYLMRQGPVPTPPAAPAW